MGCPAAASESYIGETSLKMSTRILDEGLQFLLFSCVSLLIALLANLRPRNQINGPLIEYKVEYKQEGASSGSVKSVISRTSVSLQNLQIWTKYKVQVRVNNGDYDGPLSVEMEISTYQDGKLFVFFFVSFQLYLEYFCRA